MCRGCLKYLYYTEGCDKKVSQAWVCGGNKRDAIAVFVWSDGASRKPESHICVAAAKYIAAVLCLCYRGKHIYLLSSWRACWRVKAFYLPPRRFCAWHCTPSFHVISMPTVKGFTNPKKIFLKDDTRLFLVEMKICWQSSVSEGHFQGCLCRGNGEVGEKTQKAVLNMSRAQPQLFRFIKMVVFTDHNGPDIHRRNICCRAACWF